MMEEGFEAAVKIAHGNRASVRRLGEDTKIITGTSQTDVNGNNNASSSSPPDGEVTAQNSTAANQDNKLIDNVHANQDIQNRILPEIKCTNHNGEVTKEGSDYQDDFVEDDIEEESQERIDTTLSSVSDLDITDEANLSTVSEEANDKDKDSLVISGEVDTGRDTSDECLVDGNYNQSNNCFGNQDLGIVSEDISEKDRNFEEACNQEGDLKKVEDISEKDRNFEETCYQDSDLKKIEDISEKDQNFEEACNQDGDCQESDSCEDLVVTSEDISEKGHNFEEACNQDGDFQKSVLCDDLVVTSENISEKDHNSEEPCNQDSGFQKTVSCEDAEVAEIFGVQSEVSAEFVTGERNLDSVSEADILDSIAEIDQVVETAEKDLFYGSEGDLSLQANQGEFDDLDLSDIIQRDSVCLSDSEIEMGRRSLSFKRKQQHMRYTEDEFREQYTYSGGKGKSLDSAARQEVKRGFQRLKAERTGGKLKHTRSLSTPTAESYKGNGPPPRIKSGRPISMVERGTDTTEYFKDHQSTEANIRIRGMMSPNETNNNKNFDVKTSAPFKIEVKPDLEIKPQKSQNVNAELAIKPQRAQNVNALRPRTPKSPTPRGPLTKEDLSIMSGYPNKQNGAPQSPRHQERTGLSLGLSKHLQNGVNGTNVDSRKTEIAVERQMMIKQSIKGSPDDKLSPRATTSPMYPPVSPVNGIRTRTASSPSKSPPQKAPKPRIQNSGPYTVITRIVDGEEEVTIGNFPEVARPQSAPVMSQKPHHFAVIEPVGQPVVGHPPRISQIEPVLVYPAKRPSSQQSQPINTTIYNVPSDNHSDDGNVDGPDTLSAMMSVTVTSSTMPELQKPQVTTVEPVMTVTDGVISEIHLSPEKVKEITDTPTKPTPDLVKDDVIVPQTELIVESKKELPPVETVEIDKSKKIPEPDTKSTSSVVSNASRKNRFIFPSVTGQESIEVTDSDDDEERGIYDASFRNSGWIYIGGNQELQMITGPIPPQTQQRLRQQQQVKPEPNSKVVKAQVEAKPAGRKGSKKSKVEEKKDAEEAVVAEADEAFSRDDPGRASSSTTASEEEFKKQYQSVSLRRIQRKQSIMDYQRLSLIARERELVVCKDNGLFGFRIQYSKPVVVTDVDQGGAAEKAGLKVGDMVLKVNGQDVTQAAHSQVVRMAAAGPEKLALLVGTNVCNTLNLEALKPVMTGHLWKLGGSGPGLFSGWKKRWFVLKHDNVLYYYKTKEDAEPLGAIVLCNYTVQKARDVGKPFAFKLTKHKARTYHIYAQTGEDMNSWAKAISEASRPNSTTDIWLDISTHNVSVPALSIKYPDCHGVLTKMGGRRKTWRRRYCVLKDACLYYYKDIDAPQALGVAHFHGYSIQETEIGSKKYAFILKPPDDTLRTFYFIADHETDRKRWVAAFAYSIGRWIQTNTGDDSDEEGNEMLI